MKRFTSRLLATLLILALPTLAEAHPGHDGPHDFEWDFAHLAAYPLATLLCLAVLGTAASVVWHSLLRRRENRAAEFGRSI